MFAENIRCFNKNICLATNQFTKKNNHCNVWQPYFTPLYSLVSTDFITILKSRELSRENIRHGCQFLNGVESVGIINEKPQPYVDGKKVDVTNTVFVVFVHSADAYKAIENEVLPENIAIFVPGDTCHKPNSKHNHKNLRRTHRMRL